MLYAARKNTNWCVATAYTTERPLAAEACTIAVIVGRVVDIFTETNTKVGISARKVKAEAMNAEDVARFPLPGTASPISLAFSPDDNILSYLHAEGGQLTRQVWMGLNVDRPPFCGSMSDVKTIEAQQQPSGVLEICDIFVPSLQRRLHLIFSKLASVRYCSSACVLFCPLLNPA